MISLFPAAGDAKKFSLEDLHRRSSYLQSHGITFEETWVHRTLALVSYSGLYSDHYLLTLEGYSSSHQHHRTHDRLR